MVLFETEQGAKDPGLSTSVVLSNPEDLALSDHLRCFDTFNYDSVHLLVYALRSLNRSQPALNVSMILIRCGYSDIASAGSGTL